MLIAAIPAQAGLLAVLGWIHGAPSLAAAVALVACTAGLACARLPIERWFAAPGIALSLVVPVVMQWQVSALPPILLLNGLLTMSVMASLLKPGLVAAAGVALALAPFGLGAVASVGLTPGQQVVFAAFLLVQTGLLVGVTARNARRARERFDIEFLVRAMGSEGAIRLGLDAVRAESALGSRLKQVQQRMADALRQVRQAAERVHQASSEIDGSGGELSERTERSAAGLRDAAMTLEQITVIVQSSAQAAQEAKVMAAAASEQAAQGGQLFTQVTERMKAIDQSSRRITEVIGVIDGIAFQTNILALNAAVEAARAGEQGRGFAVVAHEVRQLALRAAEAAGEVRRLINESLETVRGGSQLVDAAGRTMDEIVTSVRKVGQVFENLSDDTHEHAGSIEAVTRSVTELDAMTRQNVAVVETARRIAQALLEQGAQLEQVLGSFKLGGVATAPARTDRLAPAATEASPGPGDIQAAAPAVRTAARSVPASPVGSPVAAAAPAGETVTFF